MCTDRCISTNHYLLSTLRVHDRYVTSTFNVQDKVNQCVRAIQRCIYINMSRKSKLAYVIKYRSNRTYNLLTIHTCAHGRYQCIQLVYSATWGASHVRDV